MKEHIGYIILIIFIGIGVFSFLAAISACVLSSKISRREEDGLLKSESHSSD